MSNRIMRAEDAISGKEGMLYLTVDGRSLEFAEVTKFEAKMGYKKSDVPRVGAKMVGKKVVGSEGTGSLSMYYHRPEMRKMALDYIKKGKTPTMDAMVVNDDKTSSAGKQTALIKNIIPDEVLLALLDAESDDTLKEEFAFTFDDFDFLNQFKAPK